MTDAKEEAVQVLLKMSGSRQRQQEIKEEENAAKSTCAPAVPHSLRIIERAAELTPPRKTGSTGWCTMMNPQQQREEGRRQRLLLRTRPLRRGGGGGCGTCSSSAVRSRRKSRGDVSPNAALALSALLLVFACCASRCCAVAAAGSESGNHHLYCVPSVPPPRGGTHPSAERARLAAGEDSRTEATGTAANVPPPPPRPPPLARIVQQQEHQGREELPQPPAEPAAATEGTGTASKANAKANPALSRTIPPPPPPLDLPPNRPEQEEDGRNDSSPPPPGRQQQLQQQQQQQPKTWKPQPPREQPPPPLDGRRGINGQYHHQRQKQQQMLMRQEEEEEEQQQQPQLFSGVRPPPPLRSVEQRRWEVAAALEGKDEEDAGDVRSPPQSSEGSVSPDDGGALLLADGDDEKGIRGDDSSVRSKSQNAAVEEEEEGQLPPGAAEGGSMRELEDDTPTSESATASRPGGEEDDDRRGRQQLQRSTDSSEVGTAAEAAAPTPAAPPLSEEEESPAPTRYQRQQTQDLSLRQGIHSASSPLPNDVDAIGSASARRDSPAATYPPPQHQAAAAARNAYDGGRRRPPPQTPPPGVAVPPFQQHPYGQSANSADAQLHRGRQQYQHRNLPPHLQQQPPRQPAEVFADAARRGVPQRPIAAMKQQQQQQMADPSPPSSRSRRGTPAWKQVWRKIERGLDNLADLEDAVSGKAQQLYETTLSSVARIPSRKGGDERSSGGDDLVTARWDRQKKGATPTWLSNKPSSQPSAEEVTFDLSRFQKKVVAAKKVDEPVSSKYRGPLTAAPTSRYAGKPVEGTPQKQETRPATVRRVDWNSAVKEKMIRANGGASVPHDALNEGDESAAGGSAGSVGSSSQGVTRDLNPYLQQMHAQPRAFTKNAELQAQSPGSFGERRPRPSVSASVRKNDAMGQNRARRLSFDDDEDSWAARLGKLVPPIPRLSSLNPFRERGEYRDFSSATLDAWKADDDESKESGGFLGLFRRKQVPLKRQDPAASRAGGEEESVFNPTISDLMDRCDNGKSVSLLTAHDVAEFRSVGRARAALDVVKLISLLFVARQLSYIHLAVPRDLSSAVSGTIAPLLSAIADAVESWIPFALATALLAALTDSVLCNSRLGSLSRSVEESVKEEARYGSLFLRVVSSSASRKDTSELIREASRKQALGKVQAARLRFFVACFLGTLIVTTVSMLKPLLISCVQAFVRILSLEEWRMWPPQWRSLLTGLQNSLTPLSEAFMVLTGEELSKIVENPTKVAYEASVFVVMLIVAWLPSLESKRKVNPTILKDDVEEEEEAAEAHQRLTEYISDLGVSSASRLDFLNGGRAIELLLERWKVMLPRIPATAKDISSSSLARILGYDVFAGILLSLPLVVFGYTTNLQLPWDTLLDSAMVLLFTHNLVGQALRAAVLSKDAERPVASFMKTLAGAVEERNKLIQSQVVNLQLQASMNPTAGVLVKDLWAAHTTKRAWAVRGTNLSCRNGEIVMLLGDPGSGKSRLLTALAEAATAPPKRALSSNIVRGTVSFGGVDSSKWDKRQLNRRLGLLLNDVRTTADTAKVLSGLTLEEILEPSSTTSALDPSHSPGSSERSSMILALKITGLYSSLLPRLPSKLSTVVTANEEDLRPSALRPRYSMLTPGEWSKLLLSRVLAQAIYDNDNSAGSSENVDNSLVGSFLLLDDVTNNLSEIDEARLLQDLRRTGAATIVSSTRWATGRFADRIAVLRDGAIVESGTHNELLNRGPQQSIYAAKWHAMTTQ